MKKLVLCLLATAAVLIGALLYIGPVVLNDDGLTCRLSAAIDSQARGLYSDKLWLVPVVVNVTGFTDKQVEYTIFYLPFGTVDMSYTKADGYNMKKPLTGL